MTIGDGGRTITYTLRDGLKWSDGTPLTARDYQFTYQRMVDPAVDHPYRQVYASIAGVDSPDDRTLTWAFRESFCPAIDFTVINPIPRHVFDGADLARHPASLRPTVGSGPFLLEAWNTGRDATFRANGAFYLGKPRIDRYTMRLVADAAQGWAIVKAGEADLASINASDVADAAGSHATRVITHYPATSSWTYLGMNLRHRILTERAVRQAIAHAIDRETIIQQVRFGHARTIDTPFGRESWATSRLPTMEYDPAKAARLLDDAQWLTGVGGARSRDGVPLLLTLRYPIGNRERELIGEMITTQLRAIGIQIQPLTEPLSELIDRVNVTHEYDLCVLGWTTPIEPHGTREIWATDGAQNGSGLADATIDALYEQAATVLGCDRAERARTYAEVQRRIDDAIPCVFLYETESLTAMSARLTVNQTTRLGWDYRPWQWSTTG